MKGPFVAHQPDFVVASFQLFCISLQAGHQRLFLGGAEMIRIGKPILPGQIHPPFLRHIVPVLGNANAPVMGIRVMYRLIFEHLTDPVRIKFFRSFIFFRFLPQETGDSSQRFKNRTIQRPDGRPSCAVFALFPCPLCRFVVHQIAARTDNFQFHITQIIRIRNKLPGGRKIRKALF